MRKIIHIDMDAFFASVEQRDNPALRGLPVAVGHAGERGVVAAASYEARKFGVRSAMSSKMAMRRCPQLIFVPGRFEAYKEVSAQIHEIFNLFTDLVEPLSLDEAYLDVTGTPSATLVAQEIRRRIRETTGLTASAGVSVNKFLAKIASDYRKPDGMFVITPEQAETFVESLRIEQFWGVGAVTAEKMHRLHVHSGADLKRQSLDFLTRHFGKFGSELYDFARAIDNRPVESERVRKSIGAENTYSHDISAQSELRQLLRELAAEVWRRASKREFFGRTVTLKVKYADFEQITRSRTPGGFVTEFDTLGRVAEELLAGVAGQETTTKKIRLMGLSLANAADLDRPEVYQLEFDFEADADVGFADSQQ